MKKLCISFLLLFTACLIPGLTYGQNVRSMWVWSSSSGIIENSTTRADFYKFCSNPPGYKGKNSLSNFPPQINLIYLSVHSYVNGDSLKRAKMHQFLKDAHSKGLKVEYLDGDAKWATTNQASAKTYIDNFCAFNMEAIDTNEKFDGVQYDVEPYLLSGWSDATTKIEIWNSYIQLLTYCQAKVDSLNDKTYFGVAVPRWFDSNPGPAYQKQLQDLVDYVAIMDYVDTSPRIISDAGTEIVYAEKIGKKVIVGVETQKIDPGTSTYYEEGWGNMESNLYEVNEYFKNYKSYSGIAIHHYDYYKNFPQWGTSGKDINSPFLINTEFKTQDTTCFFRLNIVDICGSGIDMNKTFASAAVIYNSPSGKDTLKGTWKNGEDNYFLFYPVKLPDPKGTYQFKLQAYDSAGNYKAVSSSITISISSLEEERGENGLNYNLLQNYPNPFNPVTNIAFELKNSGFTSLSVYNIAGQKVASLVNNYLPVGRYDLQFDAKKLTSGIYFYRLSTSMGAVTKKMLLLR